MRLVSYREPVKGRSQIVDLVHRQLKLHVKKFEVQSPQFSLLIQEIYR